MRLPLGGLVLSGSFASQSRSERQDHIWKYLDAHLSRFERTRIVFHRDRHAG